MVPNWQWPEPYKKLRKTVDSLGGFLVGPEGGVRVKVLAEWDTVSAMGLLGGNSLSFVGTRCPRTWKTPSWPCLCTRRERSSGPCCGTATKTEERQPISDSASLPGAIPTLGEGIQIRHIQPHRFLDDGPNQILWLRGCIQPRVNHIAVRNASSSGTEVVVSKTCANWPPCQILHRRYVNNPTDPHMLHYLTKRGGFCLLNGFLL